MTDLRIWVFDVDQGLCVFIKAPNGRTLLYDCGRKRHFSPASYLARFGLLPGRRLDQLVVSHPHADHLWDLKEVIERLQPETLRRQLYDWDEVRSEGVPYKYQTWMNEPLAEAFETYLTWQSGFPAEPPSLDWGDVRVETFALTPDEARTAGPRWINNSSLVLVVSRGAFKVVVPGDLEEDGWRLLLEREDFRAALSGASVFVTPFHGHTTGYSPGIYEAMGKPAFNFTSIHLKSSSLAMQYREPASATGYEDEVGKTRYVFTNWNHGSLLLRVDEAGAWRALFHRLLTTQPVESTPFVRGQRKLVQ